MYSLLDWIDLTTNSLLDWIEFDQKFSREITRLFFLFVQDHSQGGQKLIDPHYTMYGNEVYWGCFASNTLGYAIPLTTHIRRLMTPDYCIYRCRYPIQDILQSNF